MKKSIVEGFASGFKDFICTFKEHGLSFCLFILLIFLASFSFIIHPININELVVNALQKEKQIELEKQKKSIEQRMAADKLIVGIMNDLIERYSMINRICLLETHNGSQNLSGIEYLFASMTIEVINTYNTNNQDVYEMDYIADHFYHQHLSNLFGQSVWNRMKYEKYLYFNNLESYHRSTYRFVNKFKEIGANSLILIPFCSNNIPVIMLVITSKENNMPCDQIYNFVDKFRGEIEKNLMEIEF